MSIRTKLVILLVIVVAGVGLAFRVRSDRRSSAAYTEARLAQGTRTLLQSLLVQANVIEFSRSCSRWSEDGLANRLQVERFPVIGHVLRIGADGELLDTWGNALRRRVEGPTCSALSLKSSGPNGEFEDAGGDDIEVETEVPAAAPGEESVQPPTT